MPHAYVRYTLAKHWNVPPWLVDAAPMGEVREALAIMTLEGEAEERRERRRKGHGG